MKILSKPIKKKKNIRSIKEVLKKISYRDYLIFSLGVSTGLKLSEILGLKVKVVRENASVTFEGNDYKVEDSLLKKLKEFASSKDNDDFIFTADNKKKKQKKKLTNSTVLTNFKKVCDTLNIDKINSDTLRKTYGYHYYMDNNGDTAHLKKLFNKRYAQVLEYIAINEREINKRKQLEKDEPFIGRENELNSLHKFIEPVLEGKFGGIFYVDGDAGIGKTALLVEFKKQVVEKYKEPPVNFLYLPCDEIVRKSLNPIKSYFYNFFDQSSSDTKSTNKKNFEKKFKKFLKNIENYKHAVLKSDSKNNGEHTYHDFQEIGYILKELIRTKSIIAAVIDLEWKDSLYSSLDNKAKFKNTLYSIKNFVKASSLLSPVILHIEDGHWIDEGTKELLKILVRNVEEFPFMVISTSRFISEAKKTVNFNTPEKRENRILLEEFSDTKTKDFIKKLSEIKNRKLSKREISHIVENSDGNAYYITKYLSENSLKDISTRSELILDKIKTMQVKKQHLVKTAAVMGNRIDMNILNSLFTDTDIVKIQTGFFIITAANEVSFDHALTKDIIYSSMDEFQLKKIHKKIACTFENKYRSKINDYYEDIAYHYDRGCDINDKSSVKKAMSYLEKAGDKCRLNYSNEKAIEYYERLLKLIENKFHNKHALNIMIKIGEIKIWIGIWDEAELLFLKLIEYADKLKLEDITSRCYRILGEIYWKKGKYELSKESYKVTLKKNQAINDNKELSSIYGGMGVLLRSEGKMNEAIKSFNLQRKISKKTGYLRGVASANGNIGVCYWYKGLFKKALKFLNLQLETSEEIKYYEGIASAIGNIGIIYYSQSNYTLALKYFKKQLKMTKEIAKIDDIINILGNIGVSLWLDDKRNKSLKYFNEQIKYSKEIGYEFGIAHASGNIGVVYTEIGELNKAKPLLETQLSIFEKIGVKEGVANAFDNIGYLHMKLGDYKKALFCLKKSLKIFKEINNISGNSIAYGHIGEVYYHQKIFDLASEYFEKAIVIQTEMNMMNYLCENLYFLSEVLYVTGDLNSAKEKNEDTFTYLKKFHHKSIIFTANILKQKIDFIITDNIKNKYECIENLKSMLGNEKSEENIALLNYETALLLHVLKRKEFVKYKEPAIAFYKKLFKSTPKIDYKNKYEELEKLDL